MQRIKAWLKLQNERGRHVAVGSVLRWILSLYRFHPRERFVNGLKVKYKTTTGTWRRLSFERSTLQRVFHVCLENTPDGRMVAKFPRGDNSYSCDFIQAVRSDAGIQNYRDTLAAIGKDPWLMKHYAAVVAIRRDGGYTSKYIEGFNLAHLRDELFDAKAMHEHFRASLVKAIKQLAADLRGYHAQQGQLIGDWGLHNLVFSPENASVVNVDAEGFFAFNRAKLENSLAWIEGYMRDIVEFLQLLDSPSPEAKKAVAVFQILDEVRRSGESYSGIDFLVGYHSLELNGRLFRGQRECSKRLAQIPYDFKGRVVVDLRCNSGGMLHALAKKIRFGYGFDFNPKCVNAAQAIKSLIQSTNLEFFNFDLDRDDLSLLPCLLLRDKVHVCFLLSVCMWLKRWRAVVHHAAMMAEALLFDSNGTLEQQNEQVLLLHDYFDQIQVLSDGSPDDPFQDARKLYLCSGRKIKAQNAEAN